MVKKYAAFWAIAIALTIMLPWAKPSLSQLPILPKINLETFKLDHNLGDSIISACVRLDGRCVFELSDQKSNLGQRIKYTEERLANIKKLYLQDPKLSLRVFPQAGNNQQSIYVALGEQKLPILSLNNRDASIHVVTLDHHAQQIADQIEQGLIRTRRQRESSFILQQAKIAGGIILLMILLETLLLIWFKRLQQEKRILTSSSNEQSLVATLDQRKAINLKEVQYRMLQLVQIAVGVGGSLGILGLFAQTRLWQLWIITLMRIPLRLIIVIISCYLLIRLSYAAIARINTAITNNTFANNYVFLPDTTQRLQVRVNTFSRLFRGMVTLLWIGISLFVALSILGFNITPFLAGAGVLGLAFSFASQNLIKDTINGLLIIFEDQYAVGDVVTIGEVGGMVENLNLRITQLRDAEGRLITIPNSAIVTVANHSNGWSRSDLRIPFAYQTNADQAIEIVQEVATQMYEDGDCRQKILEPPQVLGIEDFAERGYIVRLWFKTEPLKQWEVAREFRRRVRNAFEAAGISLPLPQQQIWLHRHHHQQN
ncbi:MAG: mechanosensitive ion channel family protein [Cyanobacteria bacterium P01_E01_bin.35]